MCATNAHAIPKTRGYPCRWPDASFGNLAIKAGGQIVSNLAELLLNNVEIIDEPFGCRCYGLLKRDRLRSFPVIFQEDTAVFENARKQWPPLVRTFGDGLSGGKGFGMLLQALDTEQFSANRLFEFREHD